MVSKSKPKKVKPKSRKKKPIRKGKKLSLMTNTLHDIVDKKIKKKRSREKDPILALFSTLYLFTKENIHNMSSEFKYTKDMIEWRRNTVLQKLSLGYSQSEIARELKLHPSTISLDCQYLRLKANEDFHTYLQEELPREFQKAIVTYEYAIKTAARTAESTDDDKTRLQAVKEMREARTAKMDLISNHDVMSYQVNKQPVSGKMTQTNESEQSTDLEESEQESEGETEELQGEGQDADRE